ncbi:GGDEF domain-containing protein [Sphingomonas adhaesiva]|uniref:GGDEF domain-containing protein n=1 Tax=Sphingomonas adhaesiva TaxID=28212 RepID=UPI002FF80A84
MPRQAARAATLHQRMLGWLQNDTVPSPPAPAPNPLTENGRTAVRRQLYRDVGEFLFSNGLEPTPRNFMVAHSYLSGENWEIGRAVADHLHSGKPLSDGEVGEIVERQRASQLTPDRLAELASQLEARLNDCVSAVDTTRDSAATFGSALNEEAANLNSDPVGTLHRVIALTREAVETARLAELQLQQTRREADALRSDLEQARRAAEQDHLTGLPNRRCFEARLATAMAEPGPRNVTVALCDIDDFKQVNDRHGHPAGDRVLRFVGDFLRTQLGRGAMVARYGGEEFACLFEGETPHGARAALNAVRDKLATRSLVNQESGLSIGVVTFSAGVAPIVDGDVHAAMQDADAALYTAKRNGKDAVVVART